MIGRLDLIEDPRFVTRECRRQNRGALSAEIEGALANKSAAAWDKGDFDYDGSVTGSDFTALVGNLGKSASGADVVLPASDYAAIGAFAAANGLMADVPEPSSLGLLGLAAAGVLARRRSA